MPLLAVAAVDESTRLLRLADSNESDCGMTSTAWVQAMLAGWHHGIAPKGTAAL